ncbi:hypothetical protein ARAM_005687, partial [Aspergillus rambellii]
WVMLHERDTFVRLPNEQLIYTSPPRTSFALQPLPSYTGRDSLSLQSSTGRVYLTSQRVVYIPAQTSKDLESFSAPLLNIHDSHVSSPFFGPNAWIALVQPVAGGGIPPSLAAVQLKVTFKEGGAFEFHNQFERIKERLQHAVEISRETGRGPEIAAQVQVLTIAAREILREMLKVFQKLAPNLWGHLQVMRRSSSRALLMNSKQGYVKQTEM